jgi:hypothetical protein
MKAYIQLAIMMILTMLLFTACNNDIDEEVLPIIGVYEGHIVGVAGPFSMSISADGNDDIIIDAPFDGTDYLVVEADTDDRDWEVDIDIRRQWIDDFTEIWGDGLYFDGTIQIDYEVRMGNQLYAYRLVASKL